MLMRLSNLFRKTKQKEKPSRFSDFFLNAPDKEKERVLREAANTANEEQREVFMRSRLKAKTS